jgi:hypothetical protein
MQLYFLVVLHKAATNILSPDELAKVTENKLKSDKTILFTIGYEGVSLEEYLNRLIRNDVNTKLLSR